MDSINFNTNWNGGKCNNDHFTTIRLWSEQKYSIGNRLNLHLKNRRIGMVEVVSVKKIYLNQLNDWMCWMDTGYSAEKTKAMLMQMYKNKPTINWQTQALAYVMLRRIKDEQQLF